MGNRDDFESLSFLGQSYRVHAQHRSRAAIVAVHVIAALVCGLWVTYWDNPHDFDVLFLGTGRILSPTVLSYALIGTWPFLVAIPTSVKFMASSKIALTVGLATVIGCAALLVAEIHADPRGEVDYTKLVAIEAVICGLLIVVPRFAFSRGSD